MEAAPQPTTVSEHKLEPPSSLSEGTTEIANHPETAPAVETGGPVQESAAAEPGLHRAPDVEPESVAPAPTTPLQAIPQDGESGPLEEPSVALPCVTVGSSIVEPVSVTVGTRLCSADSSEVAVIKRITEKMVMYSVSDKNTRCYVGDICGFSWRDAPVFRVRIDAADGHLTASLISRN